MFHYVQTRPAIATAKIHCLSLSNTSVHLLNLVRLVKYMLRFLCLAWNSRQSLIFSDGRRGCRRRATESLGFGVIFWRPGMTKQVSQGRHLLEQVNSQHHLWFVHGDPGALTLALWRKIHRLLDIQLFHSVKLV